MQGQQRIHISSDAKVSLYDGDPHLDVSDKNLGSPYSNDSDPVESNLPADTFLETGGMSTDNVSIVAVGQVHINDSDDAMDKPDENVSSPDGNQYQADVPNYRASCALTSDEDSTLDFSGRGKHVNTYVLCVMSCKFKIRWIALHL